MRSWLSISFGGLLLLCLVDAGITQVPVSREALQQHIQTLEQQKAALQAQRVTLLQGLQQERQRVTWYLTFVDQILQMERFGGQRDQAGAWQALTATRQRLYYQSFGQQEGAAMLADHQTHTNRYFQAVDQVLASAPQPFANQARQVLGSVWQQYTQKMAGGQEVTAELQEALRLFAQARGYPSLPPHFDYFTGTQQRIAAAMQSP